MTVYKGVKMLDSDYSVGFNSLWPNTLILFHQRIGKNRIYLTKESASILVKYLIEWLGKDTKETDKIKAVEAVEVQP